MFTLMPVIFIIGILMIAFEEKTHINKAAIAIAMSVILWNMLLIDAVTIFTEHPNPQITGITSILPELQNLSFSERCAAILDFAIQTLLGDVSETIFFILASMVIIEVIDVNNGFDIIINYFKSKNKRKLLWQFSFVTFLISAVMGNISAIIIVIAMLRKIVPERSDRLLFASMAVIASGAGGAWSPIGDVTALLLWINGNLTANHQIMSVFLPALVMLLVPLIIMTFMIPKKAVIAGHVSGVKKKNSLTSSFSKYFIFIVGVLTFISVPVFNQLWGIPPFMGILTGLAVLWIYTDRMYSSKQLECEEDKHHISKIFSRIDIATIMFFLGLLMSVQALKVGGQLSILSDFLDEKIHSPLSIAFILGICSSFLDNVALVASTIGMYPISPAESVGYLQNFVANGEFWTFLVYCAIAGGSILIIGSAAGVTAMGMENISFGYYLKKFTPLALVGYIAGAAVYLLLG